MKTLTIHHHIKALVALSALTLTSAFALTSSAQAAPKAKHLSTLTRQHDIIGQKNPAIYDGPDYDHQLKKVQVQKIQAQKVQVQKAKVQKPVSHGSPRQQGAVRR